MIKDRYKNVVMERPYSVYIVFGCQNLMMWFITLGCSILSLTSLLLFVHDNYSAVVKLKPCLYSGVGRCCAWEGVGGRILFEDDTKATRQGFMWEGEQWI